MSTFPVGITFIDTEKSPESLDAWTRLQHAIGEGTMSAILETPERRGASPGISHVACHLTIPGERIAAAEEILHDFGRAWAVAFETIMNRRWNLHDNPYARIRVLPGMILLHEDPLGFLVDEHAADIAAGRELEAPHCTILMPAPRSHHERVSLFGRPLVLPHADMLSHDLDAAAREEGHSALVPLTWDLIPPRPRALDIVEAG